MLKEIFAITRKNSPYNQLKTPYYPTNYCPKTERLCENFKGCQVFNLENGAPDKKKWCNKGENKLKSSNTPHNFKSKEPISESIFNLNEINDQLKNVRQSKNNSTSEAALYTFKDNNTDKTNAENADNLESNKENNNCVNNNTISENNESVMNERYGKDGRGGDNCVLNKDRFDVRDEARECGDNIESVENIENIGDKDNVINKSPMNNINTILNNNTNNIEINHVLKDNTEENISPNKIISDTSNNKFDSNQLYQSNRYDITNESEMKDNDKDIRNNEAKTQRNNSVGEVDVNNDFIVENIEGFLTARINEKCCNETIKRINNVPLTKPKSSRSRKNNSTSNVNRKRQRNLKSELNNTRNSQNSMFDISSSAYLSSVSTIITNLNYEKYVKYKELISNSLKRKKELETSISNLESSIKIIKNKQKNLRNENSLIIYDIKKMKGISSRIEETNKYLKNEVGGINYGKQCQLIKNETRIINSIAVFGAALECG